MHDAAVIAVAEGEPVELGQHGAMEALPVAVVVVWSGA